MLKKITNTILVLGIFLFINSSYSAQAQYQSPVNVYSGIATQRIMTQNNINAAMINGMIRSQMSKGSAGRSGSRGRSSARTTAKRTPADPLSYSHAGANSIVKPLAAQMVEKGNPEQQKETEQIFQQFIKEYREVADKDGFPSNDIAYAMEYFLSNNYHVYYNVFYETRNSLIFDSSKIPNFINLNVERTLYGQFRQMFLNDPKFSKLSNKDKQQFTETLAIMTNVVWAMYDNGIGNNDKKMIEQAQMMAKENLENIFDTSVDNIVVNDDGISFNK